MKRSGKLKYEILVVPHEYIDEIFPIITRGIRHSKLSKKDKQNLLTWINVEHDIIKNN